ncbi:MAG: HDIG domain-containing protein [Paludibacteraceae bacterium]|nr:HDIG domain-containing protein [Paludibacteraceae bacterium]
MDPLVVIKKYVDPSSDAYRILIDHSTSVAKLALQMGKAHPELNLDLQFVEEAAMLHDIGIIKTAAESLDCHGDEPYICHGVLGAELLRAEGLEKHALVCERHTGTGLSKSYIDEMGLPIPSRDMLPVSLEEKLICYADKFFSKTHLGEQRTVEVARKKLEKFGPETLKRFDEFSALFG